jgi:hypothetical protein
LLAGTGFGFSIKADDRPSRAIRVNLAGVKKGLLLRTLKNCLTTSARFFPSSACNICGICPWRMKKFGERQESSCLEAAKSQRSGSIRAEAGTQRLASDVALSCCTAHTPDRSESWLALYGLAG